MMTKTRSFQTIGLDWLWSNFAFIPTPGSGDFQMMFSFAAPPQVSKTFFSSATPCPAGPRHAGQTSPACAAALRKSAAATAMRLAVTLFLLLNPRLGVAVDADVAYQGQQRELAVDAEAHD